MNPDVVTALVGAGGALFGALVGGLVTYYANRRLSDVEATRRKSTITASLRSEIATHLALAEEGNYLRVWEEYLAQIQSDNFYDPSELLLVYASNFPVFHATVGELGLLSEDAATAVVQFYTLAEDALKTCEAFPAYLNAAKDKEAAASAVEDHVELIRKYLKAGSDALRALEN